MNIHQTGILTKTPDLKPPASLNKVVVNMANRTEREIGGYEAEFVTTLPNEYECPICQLAYRDPVQLEECGHRLCYSCLQELRRR